MLKVVAIDDNPITLQSIVTTINWEELGCVVIGAFDNGEDALKIISEQHADIVVSDIKMPRLDGLAITEALSAMDINAKIILITGFHEFELAQRALKLGAFDLLAKPFSNEELRRAVKNAADALIKERWENPRPASAYVPAAASPLVRRAVAYIEEMFSDEITLDIISEKLNVNPSYLSRAIKKETGSGFVEILTDIRLEAAKNLLKQPDMKVYTAAKLAGYSDYSYFYQVFKKHYGISPKEYRERTT